jgi:hypothetical protein
MKKTILISIGLGLLIILIINYYNAVIKDEPEYLIVSIPNPQYSSVSPFSSEYAHSEEFSTFVWHDSGHMYFIWRMYTRIWLDEEMFHAIDDVEKYYDNEIRKLGWNETRSQDCNSYMSEFRPDASYKAFTYPTKYYKQPIACLAVWSEFDSGDSVTVLIKTINPSRNVLSDWDNLYLPFQYGIRWESDLTI